MSKLSDIAITTLRGVGPKVAERLAHLHIHSVQDLLFHLPSRYQDRTKLAAIRSLRAGDACVVEGQVVDVQIRYTPKRVMLCRIQDASGELQLRFFYFTAAQQQRFKSAGARVRCYGEVKWVGKNLEMIHPEYSVIDGAAPAQLDDTLTPIYPTTEGVNQNLWRKLIGQAVQLVTDDKTLTELLPQEILDELALPTLADALRCLHAPSPEVDMQQLLNFEHPAQQRLAFEELVAQQLSLLRARQDFQRGSAPELSAKSPMITAFLAQLPFQLTSAQQRVVNDIVADLQQPLPMCRLVQGDVGSGKTVVAALAMLQAVANGLQAAIMAPTELLAEQHWQNFREWFEPLGLTVAWLAGSLTVKQRRTALAAIADGSAQVIVGTHALFQDEVQFQSLALVVIDEQHRFGVHQRMALRAKGANNSTYPHQLVMTATPIPRTLAMTAYADLDYSVIDELPPGRTPVTTVTVPNAKRDAVMARVRANCQQGKQAYWVCTLVEESETLQCQAAEKTAEYLTTLLPDCRIALVHGRMKPADKDAVMHAFKAGDYDLLVATTVIEVGVNVPNASLMIIENPERLGLAQLHQLRGRVGRGSEVSYCVLLYQQPLTEYAKQRLQTMRETTDGFQIAQKDLELRGPGEVLGTRQTGLVQFKIADLLRDKGLLPSVQRAAKQLISEYPDAAEQLIQRWLVGVQDYQHV